MFVVVVAVVAVTYRIAIADKCNVMQIRLLLLLLPSIARQCQR